MNFCIRPDMGGMTGRSRSAARIICSRSDGGGDRSAIVCLLVESAKLNDVVPYLFLVDVLQRIVDEHTINRLDDLLPSCVNSGPYAGFRWKVINRRQEALASQATR